jgi:hypothetical protein
MRLNGYASIGHLFQLHKDQFNEGYKAVLFQLVTKLYMGLDESIVDRDGFSQFANYFKNVPVCIESSSIFIRDILKRQEVSDFSFQITVEKMVWEMVKPFYIQKNYLRMDREDPSIGRKKFLKSASEDSSFGTKKSLSLDREDLSFRIFCLFNRISDTDIIPIRLSPQGMHVMYSWLSIHKPPAELFATYGNILANITKRKDPFLIVSTKKCYDQYVRDILVEERLMFRVTLKNEKSHPEIGKVS